MVLKVLCISNIYIILIIGSFQLSDIFSKFNHLQHPGAAAFFHVDMILNQVRYFLMKSTHSCLEV